MDEYSSADPAFDKLRKRISEIERKNEIFRKKLGKSSRKISVEDVKKDSYSKQQYKIFDEAEASAVEICYKKALKWAEYYLNLRKIKKQRKMKSKKVCKQNDKHFDKHSMVSPKLKLLGKNHKLQYIPPITRESNIVCDSFNINSVILNPNEKENCITVENSNFSSLSSKRKKRKLLSSFSALDSMSIKSNDKSKSLKDIEQQNKTNLSSPVIFEKSVKSSHNISVNTPKRKINFKRGDDLFEDVVCISDTFQDSENSCCDDSTPKLSSDSTLKNNRIENNDNSDLDIVYLGSANCSAHKKKNISKARKKKSKATNKKKLAILNDPNKNLKRNSKSRNLHMNSIKMTCNQDINGELKENICSEQRLASSNENCELTRSRKVSNFEVVPEFNVIEGSVEAITAIPDMTEKTGLIDLAKDAKKRPEMDLSRESLEVINIDLTGDFDDVILPEFAKKPDEIVAELNSPREPSKAINSDLKKNAHELFSSQLDLATESDEIIPEIDLSTDSCEATNVDLTGDLDELILPELDLTEEPVDFTIPRLHLTESCRKRSDIESLKSEGVVIRGGRWSKEEENLLKRNFKDFQSRFGVYDPLLLLGIGGRVPLFKYDSQKIKKFLKAKHFYVRLGKDMNERTLLSIYNKARILFCPFKGIKDCTSNDVAAIIQLQKEYGNNWSLIGQKLKIIPKVCHVIHVHNKKKCITGRLSRSEIIQLTSAIKSVTNVSDLSDENLKGISWEKVAELVPSRNSYQCRKAWIYNQSKIYKLTSYQKWTKFNSAKLIFLLRNKFNFRDEYLINWTAVYKYFENVLHSEAALRMKWSKMKFSTPDQYKIKFSESLNFLFKKYHKYIVKINQDNI